MKTLFQTLLLVLAALTGAAAGPAHNLFRVRHVTDVNGHSSLLGSGAQTKTIVLVFLGPECPISQRYVPELNRIATQYDTNAVEFRGIISGASISRTQALAFTREYRLQFPVLFDNAGALARWLRPTHVPQAFVLAPSGDVVYRGRIDDWYESPGKPRAAAQRHELRDAISAMLAGKYPPSVFAPPVGCYFEDWPTR